MNYNFLLKLYLIYVYLNLILSKILNYIIIPPKNLLIQRFSNHHCPNDNVYVYHTIFTFENIFYIQI